MKHLTAGLLGIFRVADRHRQGVEGHESHRHQERPPSVPYLLRSQVQEQDSCGARLRKSVKLVAHASRTALPRVALASPTTTRAKDRVDALRAYVSMGLTRYCLRSHQSFVTVANRKNRLT